MALNYTNGQLSTKRCSVFRLDSWSSEQFQTAKCCCPVVTVQLIFSVPKQVTKVLWFQLLKVIFRKWFISRKGTQIKTSRWLAFEFRSLQILLFPFWVQHRFLSYEICHFFSNFFSKIVHLAQCMLKDKELSSYWGGKVWSALLASLSCGERLLQHNWNTWPQEMEQENTNSN